MYKCILLYMSFEYYIVIVKVYCHQILWILLLSHCTFNQIPCSLCPFKTLLPFPCAFWVKIVKHNIKLKYLRAISIIQHKHYWSVLFFLTLNATFCDLYQVASIYPPPRVVASHMCDELHPLVEYFYRLACPYYLPTMQTKTKKKRRKKQKRF